MSIFDKLRPGKKTADGQKSAQAQKKPIPQPYRHVPTHAGRDSLSQAPPGATAEADKRAIKEQRKRRDKMSRQTGSHSMVATIPSRYAWSADVITKVSQDQRETHPTFQRIVMPPLDKVVKLNSHDVCPTLYPDSSSSKPSSLLEISPRSPQRLASHFPAVSPPPTSPQVTEFQRTWDTAQQQAIDISIPCPQKRTPHALDFSKPRPRVPLNNRLSQQLANDQRFQNMTNASSQGIRIRSPLAPPSVPPVTERKKWPTAFMRTPIQPELRVSAE